MLKACKYCGRIHDSKYICPPKRAAQQVRWQKRKESSIDRFRSSQRWTEKSIHIRERDRYLCLACLFNLDGQGSRITTTGLSVHHIIPIAEDWDKRLDDNNLITLCEEHHERAEDGTIDRKNLLNAVNRSIDGLYDIPGPIFPEKI